MFSNGKWCINVKTVGEAVKELSLLDPSLPMDQDYDGKGADIVVMNRDEKDPHVQFAEGGFWDEAAVFGENDRTPISAIERAEPPGKCACGREYVYAEEEEAGECDACADLPHSI